LHKLVLLFFFAGLSDLCLAQELKCQVQVVASQIAGQGVDPTAFVALQTSIYEFMNNRRWTPDNFTNNEKIECNILINITKIVSPTNYLSTIEVQCRRPVYKSSYNSVLLNYLDNTFTFNYVQGQSLDYSDNTYLNNLTSVLAFYAYYILGLDYDSYALNGGTPWFQKALNISNSVSQDAVSEWTYGDKNRYLMINNMLDATYVPIRQCMYKYHRLGLDIMADNPVAGRKAIIESIDNLQKVHAIKPLSFSMQIFFNAKSDEVINIFSGATPEEKAVILPIINKIDPTNSNRYSKINSPN
jgi:hypothetical protein